MKSERSSRYNVARCFALSCIPMEPNAHPEVSGSSSNWSKREASGRKFPEQICLARVWFFPWRKLITESMVLIYASFKLKIRCELRDSGCGLRVSGCGFRVNSKLATRNISFKPSFENSSKITSIPKSIWKLEMFLVFKNPFK